MCVEMYITLQRIQGLCKCKCCFSMNWRTFWSEGSLFRMKFIFVGNWTRLFYNRIHISLFGFWHFSYMFCKYIISNVIGAVKKYLHPQWIRSQKCPTVVLPLFTLRPLSLQATGGELSFIIIVPSHPFDFYSLLLLCLSFPCCSLFTLCHLSLQATGGKSFFFYPFSLSFCS